MNQQELIQRLAEISGMAEAAYAISQSINLDSICHRIQERLDDLLDRLQAEERLEWSSRFQALHPCEHQWICYKSEKGTTIPQCEKCGEMIK